MTRLADWQVSALLSLAADGQCPACQQMHGEWFGPGDRGSTYDRLCDALFTRGIVVTPESVLRELERKGLV